MGLVNRSAVLVRPRDPYLQWAKRDDTTGIAETVFQKMRSVPTTYLIPEDEDVEDARDLIRGSWPAVFEAMLEGWVVVPKRWPPNRTLKMFEDWFEIDVSECVHDLVVGETIDEI